MDPRFQSFYEDDDSPLVKEIQRLERALVDPAVTDHIKLIQVKSHLHGLMQVRRILEGLAKQQAEPEVPQAQEPGYRFLRSRPGVG